MMQSESDYSSSYIEEFSYHPSLSNIVVNVWGKPAEHNECLIFVLKYTFMERKIKALFNHFNKKRLFCGCIQFMLLFFFFRLSFSSLMLWIMSWLRVVNSLIVGLKQNKKKKGFAKMFPLFIYYIESDNFSCVLNLKYIQLDCYFVTHFVRHFFFFLKK